MLNFSAVISLNQSPHCTLEHKTHSARQFYKTTKSTAKRRTWNAEPWNVMFFGCVFSVKVLTVIMLHWWYAEMREAFNLCPYNCESTTHCGIHAYRLFFFFTKFDHLSPFDELWHHQIFFFSILGVYACSVWLPFKTSKHKTLHTKMRWPLHAIQESTVPFADNRRTRTIQ